jgi:hypothetical protein
MQKNRASDLDAVWKLHFTLLHHSLHSGSCCLCCLSYKEKRLPNRTGVI